MCDLPSTCVRMMHLQGRCCEAVPARPGAGHVSKESVLHALRRLLAPLCPVWAQSFFPEGPLSFLNFTQEVEGNVIFFSSEHLRSFRRGEDELALPSVVSLCDDNKVQGLRLKLE